MPATAGNLKAKSFTLQGHGMSGADVKMVVKDDEFQMKMGNDVLMTVAPDGDTVLAGAAENAVTKLTISKDTVFEGKVTVEQGVTDGGISDELKVLITSAMNPEIFFQGSDVLQDANNVTYVPFNETKKIVQASVHVQKNGDIYSNHQGVGQLGVSTSKPTDDLYHYSFSLAKTMHSTLLAKMISDGLLERNMKLKDIFPQMNNITFKTVRPPNTGETADGTAKTGKAEWGGWPTFDETEYEYVIADPIRDATVTDVFTDSFPLQQAGDGLLWNNLLATGLMKHTIPYCDFDGDAPVAAAANGELSLRAEEIFGNFMTKVADPDNSEDSQTLYYYKEVGTSTYTSSEYFAAAILEKIYNDHHALVGDARLQMEKIFKLEIGDKIGSDLFFYVNDANDPRINEVSNIVVLHQDVGGNVDGFMHDAKASGKEGREWYKLGITNGVTPRFNSSFAYVHGRASDWINLGRLLSRKGVYTKEDGTTERLIDASDLAYMMRPHRERGEREEDVGYYKQSNAAYGFLGHPTGISDQDQYIFDSGDQKYSDAQSSMEFVGPKLFTHFKGWVAIGMGGVKLLFSMEHDACIFITAQQRIDNKTYNDLQRKILKAFVNELN